MRRALRWSLLASLLTIMAAAPARAEEPFRGPTRVDFDERLIKGQTTKTGSVYIFDRQEIAIDSLVSKKRSFRARIIRTVFED